MSRVSIEDLGFDERASALLAPDELAWIESVRRKIEEQAWDSAVTEVFKRLEKLLADGLAEQHKNLDPTSLKFVNQALDALKVPARVRHRIDAIRPIRNDASHHREPGATTPGHDALVTLVVTLDVLTSAWAKPWVGGPTQEALRIALNRLAPWHRMASLDGVPDALTHVRRRLTTPLAARRSLDVLGLDLAGTWGSLRTEILRRSWSHGLDIRMLCVDPESAAILEVTSSARHTWVSHRSAKDSLEQIAEYASDDSEGLRARGISLEVRAYPDPPTLHGYLVDDRELVWSLCEFHEGRLTVGPRPYRQVDETSPRAVDTADLKTFRSWFAHHWARGRTIVALP